MQKSRIPPFLFLLWLVIAGCANPGTTLTGGQKDEVAPKVVRSVPENFSTRFTATEVDIQFDEYLKAVPNIKQKLIISPVMKPMPEVSIRGRNVHIKFLADLLPDRTYTLNFGDAIADLNEGNIYENFNYVFATGDKLDSLEIAGAVIKAADLSPMEGAVVMLYDEDKDSLPYQQIPVYLSVTDKTGRFHLKNLAAGSYKLFVLKDANTNFLYDRPTEEIGFIDSLITPGVRELQPPVAAEMPDSLMMEADSLAVEADSLGMKIIPMELAPDSLALVTDSVAAVPDSLALADSLIQAPPKPLYEYYPLNLEIKTFTEVFLKQTVKGTSRPTANQIQVIFQQAMDSVRITQITPNPSDSASFMLEPSGGRDTLTLWTSAKALYESDTIALIFDYNAYDSLEQATPGTDTLRFTFRQPDPKPGEEQKNPFRININFNRTLDPGVVPRLDFSEPWSAIDTSKILFARTRDTLRFPEPALFEAVPPPLVKTNEIPLISRSLLLKNQVETDSSYVLTLLPGAFTSFSGGTNDTLKVNFRVGNPDQFGSILLNILHPEEAVILQLISGKDKVVEQRFLSEGGEQRFTHLKPGKYKFLLIYDSNHNGKWDPGRYLKGLQPERILFYGKELDLKANWELEETWNLEEE